MTFGSSNHRTSKQIRHGSGAWSNDQTPISSVASAMAAFNAADVPVPGDPAPPQSDVRNFMAMMVEGQRQQHAAQLQQPQQQRDQQFLQIMQHFSGNMAGGQVPSGRASEGKFDGGYVPSVKQFLDERYFRRINKFDNKESTWKEWRGHFVSAVREASPELQPLMVKAEALTWYMMTTEVTIWQL